ncbi:MAG: ABC transporter ATP-binding protein [Bacteroidia bacterium]
MIEVKNVHKKYGELPVLKGVNLKIEAHEIVSIVGASGAGKTTLLQIIGTLDNPDSGEVIINNTNVFKLKQNQLSSFRNQQIGFVFQFHQLLPEFTALENVCIPAFIAGVSKTDAEEKANHLLQYLGLSQRLNHKPAQLSGGEQQRVAVARALINNPSVVLADEPSGNLDSANAQSLHDLFFELRNDFKHTFVIVTHNTSLAERSDRILTIKDGMIV